MEGSSGGSGVEPGAQPMGLDGELKIQRERFFSLFDQARIVVPFTGAGISTASGIPDFRSPGGAWTRNRPIDFGAFLASPEARREAWRRRFAMDDVFVAAKP